jgi:hypothetical protein
VERPVQLHGRDGRALEGGEQDATKRVAQRDAEAALERLDDELGVVVAALARFDVRALRRFDDVHLCVGVPLCRLRYPRPALRAPIVRLAAALG